MSVVVSAREVVTNVIELKEIIKNKKTTGIDEISIRIFETLPDSALHVLVQLINDSFAAGKFPSFLKTSLIVPIHKGGNTEDPSNYRPIALIPALAKLIEKLVKIRMIEFLTFNNILSEQQYGFQNNKGTSDAIFSFMREVYTGLNAGEAAAAVFCDLTKAFDCVNHGILLQKLLHLGLRGNNYEWFESYLTGRNQVVKTDAISELGEISSGVPQGSVLGPILFLIYINDISNSTISGKLTLFADDATILWHNKSITKLHEELSVDINKIKNWCDSNLLSFNVKKTNIITFRCSLPDVPMSDGYMENTSLTRFLGLNIDNKLKFDNHVMKLSKKIASGCYAVRVISNELGYSASKTSYYALVESHLRYGIPFWGVCKFQLMQQIFTLQKRAVRYICKAKPRDSCKPLFINNRILTVISIFIMETVCLIHKNKNSFEIYPTQYATRQSERGQIKLPTPTTTQVIDSLIYNGIRMYNRFPKDVSDIVCPKFYKKSVKEILLSKAYYTLNEFLNDTI